MLLTLLNRLNYYRRSIRSRVLRRWGGFAACGNSSFSAGLRIDRPEFIHIGDGCFFCARTWLYCVEPESAESKPSLRIGDNSYIGFDAHITCARAVTLGRDCLLANRVYIADNAHGYEDVTLPPARQPLKIFEVVIGDEVWIGENACIFGQVKIGRHCVIAANSVVKDCEIPDYCVVAGAPARIVRRLDSATGKWRRTDSRERDRTEVSARSRSIPQ